MSDSSPMARHCIPQKQTHQIAITALRRAAPARAGWWQVPPALRRRNRRHRQMHPTGRETSLRNGRQCPCCMASMLVDEGDVRACYPSGRRLQCHPWLQSVLQRTAPAIYKQILSFAAVSVALTKPPKRTPSGRIGVGRRVCTARSTPRLPGCPQSVLLMPQLRSLASCP